MAEKKKKKQTKKNGGEDPEEDILVRAEDYAHSSIHYSIATGDLRRLSAILASLPRLRPASGICSAAAAAAAEELLAEKISNSLDRRDVPGRETPLHLAVRLNRLAAVADLLAAGADPSLQNAAGWTPLQESVHLRKPRHLSLLLLRHHHAAAWHKWRRRLPSLLAALHQIPDFYVEISFHFESSLVPFLHAAAPSDTCRIWKRGANIRADVSAAGFDGLRLLRADQSFVFLGDGDEPGSLLLLRHGRKEIYDTLEAVRTPMSTAEEEEFLSDSAMFRPGVDVTRAEFVPRTNWRGKEKTETVAQWKARAYEMQNVVFSFKTRRRRRRRELPLELNLEEDDEGFLVADVGDLAAPPRPWREEEDDGHGRRRSVDAQLKEKEVVKNLRPWVWLTKDFPLHAAELTPVLDVLAGKVKAVRRLRDVLTTKLPPGTFPVKIAIPVVPTVRAVVKFNKFVPLSPVEQFFTPPTSPGDIAGAGEDDYQKEEATWWGGRKSTAAAGRMKCVSPSPLPEELVNPFAIPGDYAWISLAARKSGKARRGKSMKVK